MDLLSFFLLMDGAAILCVGWSRGGILSRLGGRLSLEAILTHNSLCYVQGQLCLAYVLQGTEWGGASEEPAGLMTLAQSPSWLSSDLLGCLLVASQLVYSPQCPRRHCFKPNLPIIPLSVLCSHHNICYQNKLFTIGSFLLLLTVS